MRASPGCSFFLDQTVSPHFRRFRHPETPTSTKARKLILCDHSHPPHIFLSFLFRRVVSLKKKILQTKGGFSPGSPVSTFVKYNFK